jgi:predicted DNA-binding protein
MSAEQTEKKEPKYNITLTPEMERDLTYTAGRLDVPKAEIFRRAVAHFRKAVESGQVQ